MEVISEFTGVSSGENSINSGESTQIKEKKIKENKNKINNIKLATDETNFIKNMVSQNC
ncbi:hypothetical protein [Caloramator sp. E03]|uniref:hypothetical protein n=1 Tax=Caloramator sp. E03 TaxID=2576307 RepID=UPI00143D2DA6|nr:hypothetical protein [Caloramator sp. E03]